MIDKKGLSLLSNALVIKGLCYYSASMRQMPTDNAPKAACLGPGTIAIFRAQSLLRVSCSDDDYAVHLTAVRNPLTASQLDASAELE